MTGVAAGLDDVEVALQVERAAAGLAAAGIVGDLHMGDPVGVSRQGRVDVVAVVGQVEQVAEEADIAGVDPVQDLDHVVQRCAAGTAWGR